LQAQIKKLSEQRQAHIRKEIAKRADGGKGALGQKVYDTIKAQAAKKGIEYENGPSH